MKPEEFGLELSSQTIGHLQECSSNPQKSGVLPPGKKELYNVKTITIMTGPRKVLLKSVCNKDDIYAL